MTDHLPDKPSDPRLQGRPRAVTDTELLSTLFDLGREVTSVLDLEELLAQDSAAHRPAHAVQRLLGLSARRKAPGAADRLRRRLSR